jgi:hypothetical protein
VTDVFSYDWQTFRKETDDSKSVWVNEVDSSNIVSDCGSIIRVSRVESHELVTLKFIPHPIIPQDTSPVIKTTKIKTNLRQL